MPDAFAAGLRDRDLASVIPSGEGLSLQNDSLRVTLWPKQGGKLISILAQTSDGPVELLHPPLHPYNTATESSGFELSDAGGWDECLPTVAACTSGDVHFPDHGDVWRRPWPAYLEGQTLHASVEAFTVPVRFSKRSSLHGSALHINYSAVNTSKHATEFLWSAHPLFQVQEGDHILLPGSVADVRVEGSTFAGLARPDGRCAWPMAECPDGSWIDLSQVGPPDGKIAHKLFAGRLSSGWCGLYRSKLQLGILMQFDPALTPYAGLWISQAQWPAGDANRQYTVALEPTFAPYDALDKASEMGCSMILGPGSNFSWPLRLSVSVSVTYEDFLAVANDSADPLTAGNLR